jgi:hypothetical protein
MDKYTASNRLSQAPEAIFDKVFAVQGAINKTSAHSPYST